MLQNIKTASQKKKRMSNRLALTLMALPGFISLIVFSYVPLLGWAYAFFDYKVGFKLFNCDFVGLDFFRLILSDSSLFLSLRNTLIFSFVSFVVSVLPVIFAIFLNEFRNKRAQKIVQTATTFPYFISWVLVFSVFFLFLSVDEGYVNKILLMLGLIKTPLNLLASEGAVIPLQAFIGIWKSVGFSSVIYMATISGIDPEMFDAAAVDGAGRFKKILHITVPALLPTFFTLLLLSIGNFLSNGFEQFFLFKNALVYDRITVLDTYVYQVAMEMNMYSFSTALGMLKTLISLVILFAANRLSKVVRGTSII